MREESSADLDEEESVASIPGATTGLTLHTIDRDRGVIR